MNFKSIVGHNWFNDTPALASRYLCVQNGSSLSMVERDYHIAEEGTVTHFYAPSNNDYGDKNILCCLKGKRDVVIDGKGSRLVLHGRILPFVVDECQNIVLRNFHIDGERPFYSQAKIIEADSTHLVLEFYKEFPYRVENGTLIMQGDGWEMDLSSFSSLTQEYDPRTRAPGYDTCTFMMKIGRDLQQDENMPAKVFLLEAEQLEGRRVCLKGKIPYHYHVGYDLVITHERRDNPVIFIKDSHHVTLENITITFGGAMGVIAQGSENIKLQNVRIQLKEQAEGLVSTLADATHFVNCYGKVEILDCVFENMMDDGVNVHGIYTLVKEVRSPRTLVVELQHYQQYFVNIYSSGDVLRIYRDKTAEIISEVVVMRSEILEKNTILLELQDDCAVKPGYAVENITKTPEVHIAGCRMGRNRPRSVLLTSPKHSVIEDCLFYSSLYCIHICGDTSYWFESGAVKDLTIRNNRFVDWAYSWGNYAIAITPEFVPTDRAPYFHSNITIKNNHFEGFERAFLLARYTEGLVFRNNTFTPTGSYPSYHVSEEIKVENCKNIETESPSVKESRVVQ